MREYHCFYTEIAITYSQYGSIWYYYYWWYASTKERVIGCFPNGYIVEAYYLRTFLQLSHILHFTTLQKFTERVNGTMLEKIIISSFTILTYKNRTTIRWNRFVWIQSNPCFSVLCRKNKTYGSKKIHQTITDRWCSATDNLYN